MSRFDLGICMFGLYEHVITICSLLHANIPVADPFVAQFLGGIDVSSLTEDRSKRELLRVSNVAS